jgi:hypothetical protein
MKVHVFLKTSPVSKLFPSPKLSVTNFDLYSFLTVIFFAAGSGALLLIIDTGSTGAAG